jgi:hypothetical protein
MPGFIKLLLIDLSMVWPGNIRVYCRVRPFLTEEPGRPTTVDYIGENGELVVVNPSKLGAKDARKSFTFNKVFGTKTSQGNSHAHSPNELLLF